jgi:hypothetical protein
MLLKKAKMNRPKFLPVRPPKAGTESAEVQGAQQAIRDENDRRKGARREK